MRLWNENFDEKKDFAKGKLTDRHHYRHNGANPGLWGDTKGRGTRAGVGVTKSTVGERIKRRKHSSAPKGFPPARKGTVKNRAAHQKRMATLAERHPDVYTRIAREAA